MTAACGKSTDRGRTWTQLPPIGGLFDFITDILVDPATPGRLWIGRAFADSLLYESTDCGDTWIPRGPFPGSRGQPVSIAIDPADDRRMAVAVFDGVVAGCRVLVSDDGGTSWVDRTAGLPAASVGAADLEFCDDRLLVAGGMRLASGSGDVFGLFETYDDGATWSEVSDPTWPSRSLTDIEVDPTDPRNLYVASTRGILHSDDGGASWTLPAPGTERRLVLQVATLHGAAPVFAALPVFGSLRSEDGTGFTPSGTGIVELLPTGLAVDPLAPERIAVSIASSPGGGLMTSIDGSATWRAEPVPPGNWRGVEFDGLGRLHAISNGFPGAPPPGPEDGVYRREPDGTWIRLGAGPASGRAAVRLHRLRSGRLGH